MVLDNLDRIQLALDYMERNLKAEIQIEELSRMAGYSKFYYSDLFKRATGMPVRQYLVRRRLAHAIYEISMGGKMLETALEYGFDTYAGFYRAFCREYGCSPSDYLKSHHSARPYKINLKQEERIMVSKKTIRGMLSHWGMEQEPVSDVCYEGSGQVSENDFRIGEGYVLKISAMPGGLNRHLEISQALRESDIHVSEPVPTRNGQLMVQEGDLFGILCRGVTRSSLDSKKLFAQRDEETAYQFGKMIGQLHLALGRLNSDICQENHLYDSVHTWAIPEVRKRTALTGSFVKDYEQNFGALYEKLPKQVIHRNMNLSYVIMEEGTMTGITDFELSRYSVRLFDPCYAATGILAENFVDSEECILKWVPLYRKILEGYDRVMHLTEEERKAVPYVVFSIQLICVAYFSQKEKYTDLADTNERMLMRLIEHMEEVRIRG